MDSTMDTPHSPLQEQPLKSEASSTPATAAMSTASDIESDNEQYETTYDKLQKMQRRLANPDDNAPPKSTNGTIKSRRGYGASSALEELPNNDMLDISTFAVDDDERKGSMFDLDDDMSNGGSIMSNDNLSNEERKTDGRKSVMQQPEADTVAEMDGGFTEASGYGFSQGVALREDEEASMGAWDGGELDMDSDEKDGEHNATDATDGEQAETEEKPQHISTDDISQESASPPTKIELYIVVDSIFQSADRDTMTVKQVNKSVAAHFNMDKVTKDMKGMIKERLTGLVSGEIVVGAGLKMKAKKEKATVESEEEFESEEEANYDSSSDYDEPTRPDKKKPKRKSRKTSADSISDKPRKSRTGKMAKHLRDHATKLRKRQLEESRIRQEELGNIAKKEEEGPKLSEEDRLRAQAIAARFDTNREEELVKREEDRVSLIEVLRKKRLEIIRLEEEEEVEEKTIAELAVPKEDTAQNEVMIDLEDDEEEDGESSDDEELDVVAPSEVVKKPSAMDCLMAKPGDIPPPSFTRASKPRPSANSRLALRNALRAKQVKAGNRWLARELGYKTEEEHIKECMEVELKKRKQILFLEQQAALQGDKMLGASNPAFNAPTDNDAVASGDEEEDEELAMAKQLEHSDVKSEEGDDVSDDVMFGDGDDGFENPEDVTTDVTLNNTDEDATTAPSPETATPSSSPSKVTTVVSPIGSREESQTVSNVTSETEEAHVGELNNDIHLEQAQNEHAVSMQSDDPLDTTIETKDGVQESVFETQQQEESGTNNGDTEDVQVKSSKPRNSAWQEMLRKEKEMLAKQKKRQRKGGALVDGEAEEEEEEEGIVGLEDFGFSVEKKKDEDLDEENAEADEDDLEHVVDDLSDGEGDEEAGEQARQQLAAREEKERHKEIMRRMREGYDGRRGGIASGAGARGMHRFDQLVAADNREDAKRLGLLNEDEMDSDEENENGEAKAKKDSAEDDDEAALLDKMLKERFLNRDEEDLFEEENFSDDEEDDNDEQANGNSPEDDEEKEQDRLAKQFAKRARMNRILEAYEGDDEFTRSRLIDEDATMHIELKTMKKRGSIHTDNSNLGSSLFKRQKSTDSIGAAQLAKAPVSSFTSRDGSLSVALLASRSAGRKRKTTFLSGKQTTSFSRQNSTSNKSVSLSHVVFVTGESQSASSKLSNSASNLGKSTAKKSVTKFSASSSLWNRAISKNWSGK